MSLGSALAIAMSGLRANQARLLIVSSNIANAQTPVMSPKGNRVETLTGDTGASVSVTGVNRSSINSYRLGAFRASAAPVPPDGKRIAICPRNSRMPELSNVCKFYQRPAIAIDELREFIGADLGGDGGEGTRRSSMR
jgi:hypothetical protein